MRACRNRRSAGWFVSSRARWYEAARLLDEAQPALHVGARGVGQVVAVQAARCSTASMAARPASGPSRMPSATARFKATTGEGSVRSKTS